MKKQIAILFSALASFSMYADTSTPCFIGAGDDDTDPIYAKIRYNYRFINEAYTMGGDIAITSVVVNPDLEGPVDIYPGVYAREWGVTLRQIDAGAFKGCEKIRKVVLPGTIRAVNSQAFENCKDLEEVTSQWLDGGSLTFGNGAFGGCTKLTTVNFQNKVVSIGGLAFHGCTSLNQVSLGPDITSVGDSAFAGCTSLATITFNQNLSSIGAYVFNNCTNLKDVYFRGTCPTASQYIYSGAPSNIITIAEGVGTGWPTGNAQWRGRPFVFSGISICATRPREQDGLPIDLEAPNADLGFTVKYTTNGTSPSSINGIIYSNTFYIGSDVVVKAVAIKNGRVGPVVSRTFNGDVSAPSILVDPSANGTQTITFSNRTAGATIFYSLGDENLDISSRRYSEPFNVTNRTVVKAFAVCDGMRNSTSLRWDIADCQIVFDPNGGSGGGTRMCTSNACIGSMPDASLKGYTLEGWYTDKDGGSKVTSETVVEHPMTVYARWRKCVARLTITTKGVLTSVDLNGAIDVVIPERCTSIGDSAFYYLKDLESVTIPSSVRSIGYNAFCWCVHLTELTIPEGVGEIDWYAFGDCYGLTFLRIPNSVTNIGDYAFTYCKGLTSVSLGSSTAILNNTIFSGCTSLMAFQVSNDNSRYAVEQGMLLSKDKKSLILVPGGLSSVIIPYGVKTIGEAAFLNCKLNSVIIPDTVTEIGDSAFFGQSGLKSLYIPGGVTKLNYGVFRGCNGLTEIIIPGGIIFGSDPGTDPASYVFSECTNLTTVIMQEGLKGIGTGWFSGCSNLTSVTIPRSVKTIRACAFENCASLKSIVIPRNVTDIGSYVFSGCTNLTEVFLSEDYPRQYPPIRSDILIRYKPDQTVYLDANGGSVSVGSIAVQFGMPYGNLPVPSRTGYTFLGWMLNDRIITPEDCVRELGASHTLVAQWQSSLQQFTVTFDANGGVGGTSAIQDYGATIAAPVVMRVGYTFAGWSPSVAETVPASNVTYTAQWIPNQYTIAFNANGGSGTMDATTATYDSEATIAANGFTWTGHMFVGWATNEMGEVVYAAGQTVSNLTAQSDGVVTLYALWDEISVTTIENPVITPADGATFTGDSCTVTITCATEGATIYYSTDGSTPRPANRFKYTEPFTIADTAEICSFAVLGDKTSDYVTVTITKTAPATLTLAVAIDASSQAVTTGGDADWAPVDDATAVGGHSSKSGTISLEGSTWMGMSVSGSGTLSFSWKADCEKDPRNRYSYDFGSFAIDGNVSNRIDGTTAWQTVTVEITEGGAHTFRWTYSKDDYDEEDYAGEDCIWVDHVVWTPSASPSDPIPEIGSDADVSGVLAGSADARLADHIKTAVEYNAYRAWVNAKGLDHQAVKNSPRTWFSYAIGANGLVEKTFQKDDVSIDSLAIASGGSFTFELSVMDVLIGTSATAANLATVFEVQGASSLSENSFSSTNANVSLSVSANGKLSVGVTPKATCGTFFVRVLMHADAEEVAEMPTPDTPVVDPIVTMFVVTFDANGGVGGTTRSVVSGESVGTLPTVTRVGHGHNGWWTAANGGMQISASTSVTNDVTYYAHWTADTYTVTYTSGENGSGAQQTATKTYGVALALNGAIFTRSGYVQTGWATSDGGAKAYDLGASYTANATITLYPCWTENPNIDAHAKIQLWEGGPYWATTNIGAEEPWEYGYYFWWGDTIGYKRENDAWVASDDSLSDFSFSSANMQTYNKNIATLQGEGWITAGNVLTVEHDAAHVHWGGGWRMPTKQDMSDLISKCDWLWTTTNGVKGYIVSGRDDYASNSIFLPCAGYCSGTSISNLGSKGCYWSAVTGTGVTSWNLDFSSIHRSTGYYGRHIGQPVRPVQGFTE